MAGNNVIVSTPTGSGKSLIALGAHFAALARGERSFYTAPIQALVSEKFFALCRQLGSHNVGMLTGDAAVNAAAPVICCTAEVLANIALREGAGAPLSQVVMDEFHFYADPDRGWAWQVPLIELTGAQFVLMSATLGDVRRFEADLIRRTGRDTVVVRSATRPVPLDFSYARTPLHRTIEDLLAGDRAPVYVVHFTQASAVERAQSLMSANLATRPEKDAIASAIGDFRFAPGFGRTLSRFVRHGVGVHHAGMLPKYRLLVERLAQEGHLKVICGTDTLGVGINVPIRTVLFTQLSKYDGSTSRLLGAREFHQIAGRAGRAGFDSAGSVVVQAPEHVIDNDQAVAKAGDDPKKRRKLVRSKPPRGYVPWSEDTFNRLVAAPPERLTSSFGVSHAMLLNVLDRPGDGCGALKRLLTDNDEDRPAQRRHIRRAIAIYRSLAAAGVVERLAAPDEWGRRVRVTVDLQADFALNQPLSPFVLTAIGSLDPASPVHALDVMSMVEATLDNPGPVLAAQLDKARADVISRLKAEGVEYEERMAVLDKVEYPKPLRELTYELFDAYRVVHPWAADHNIAPKSVVRDMYERAMGFADYVAHYGVARSEGLVLRYLTDAYKALVQAVPEDAKTEDLLDVTAWLGELVRQVDSSLLDEWERLRHPESLLAAASAGPGTGVGPAGPGTGVGPVGPGTGVGPAGPSAPRPWSSAAGAGSSNVTADPPPVTANRRAFRVMVRNAAFRRVELAAVRDWGALGVLDGDAGWDAGRWEAAMAGYLAEHALVGTGADARAAALFQVSEGPDVWGVRQVLDDPDGFREWAIVASVDLAASDAAGAPALRPVAVERL